jgi:hypothetical protein
MLDHWFTRHPHAAGETYRQHLCIAGGFGVKLLMAGLAVLVHALIPSLFTTTGSRAVSDLHQRMGSRSRRTASQQGGPL